MPNIYQITLTPEQAANQELIIKEVANSQNIEKDNISDVVILKRSIDARKSKVKIQLKVEVFKNGEFLSSGFGSAVQGHPAEAVAWLANTLGEYEIPLLNGEFILSGSLVPLEPAQAGDKFLMELKGVGTCEINFI